MFLGHLLNKNLLNDYHQKKTNFQKFHLQTYKTIWQRCTHWLLKRLACMLRLIISHVRGGKEFANKYKLFSSQLDLANISHDPLEMKEGTLTFSQAN